VSAPAPPDIDWDALAREVERRHGATTVLLYGSHARGDATAASDVDVIALRASGETARDLEPWRGLEMDVHVYALDRLASLAETRSAALRDARVLCQRDGVGDRLLADVRARLAEPPPALAPGEQAALWAWGDKMRQRILAPDPQMRAFQRATLLVEALPCWAQVRRRWFFGGKEALRSLPREDPAMAAAYAAASAPGADVGALHRLLDVVFDAKLGRPEPRGSLAAGSDLSDAALLEAFESQAIPCSRWHHKEHLRVAYLLLERGSLEEALGRMRTGLIALNGRHGVPESLDRGYHETLTQLWLRVLHGLRGTWGAGAGFEAFLERYPFLLDRLLSRIYYSRERLRSERAKREFVEPDLAPFPVAPPGAL